MVRDEYVHVFVYNLLYVFTNNHILFLCIWSTDCSTPVRGTLGCPYIQKAKYVQQNSERREKKNINVFDIFSTAVAVGAAAAAVALNIESFVYLFCTHISKEKKREL